MYQQHTAMSIYSYGLAGDSRSPHGGLHTASAYVSSILTKSCRLFLVVVAVAVAHVVVVVVVAIPAVVAIAGSRKTRHQFIWPELSLAGLIHFAAVCR